MSSVVATVQNCAGNELAVDLAKPAVQHDIDAALLKIVAATKISPLKIMRDYASLAFGPGKISFKDYTRLRLFDLDFWAGVDRKTVAGQQRSAMIHQTINFRHDWWGMLSNKIATGAYLSAYGFPTIPTAAVYRQNLKAQGRNVVRDEQQLRAFLSEESNYPLFGKPAEGLQSLGSIGLRRFLRAEQSLETLNGSVVSLDRFVEQLSRYFPTGYIFQKFASPHPAIRSLCGDRLATVRIVTLANGPEPKLFRACWKVPAADNLADNYWRKGNLLAQIDPSNGEVLRAFSGSGLELVAHERHPDTGAMLIGFRIPYWKQMVETVLEAARLMQHVPMIGWDVAVLDQGPVIVEMNETPDFFLPQIADKKGILEPELLEFARDQQSKSADFKKANLRTFKEI